MCKINICAIGLHIRKCSKFATIIGGYAAKHFGKMLTKFQT